MSVDPICPEVESVLHMPVSCKDAKLLWYLSPLRLEVENFDGDTFGEWCVSVRKSHKDSMWWDVFWSLLWGIWLRRNAWIFEGWKKDVSEVIRKAVGLVGDFATAQDPHAMAAVHTNLECWWRVPVQGVIKINSDASIPNSSYVGLGGVMRDAVGEVVAATCLRVEGKFGADIAEALAMRHALSIALESGFRRVCVETDCLKLHSHVSKGNAPPTEFGSDCQGLPALFVFFCEKKW
ncbi:uncharacterized protein LOC110717982 [Chenopodium quinoa]|uniref:uncharacterized protein LOC110717982 n=1 Tax=Chenopodium quinoa TaxID=63459 RepID=UPI000B7981D2|nr:uncharacterized protein LOC110717982 [Chenopodium quinoa]